MAIDSWTNPPKDDQNKLFICSKQQLVSHSDTHSDNHMTTVADSGSYIDIYIY